MNRNSILPESKDLDKDSIESISKIKHSTPLKYESNPLQWCLYPDEPIALALDRLLFLTNANKLTTNEIFKPRHLAISKESIKLQQPRQSENTETRNSRTWVRRMSRRKTNDSSSDSLVNLKNFDIPSSKDSKGSNIKQVKTQWAITRINTFSNNSKTFEILESMDKNPVVNQSNWETEYLFALLPDFTIFCYVPV